MTASKSTPPRPGIVILGTPRSGTTLLRRILDVHPGIACPPETYLLGAAARFLHEEAFSPGLRIGVLAGLGYAGFDEADVLARLRSFVLELFEDHANAQGKRRWAEKTAFDTFHVPAIRRLCSGHVQFVCIQRHGIDSACSLAELVEKTGGYVEALHAYVRRYPEPLEALARAWVDTATDLADLVDQESNVLDLRYEELVREPERVVQGLLEFLGEPWDDELIGRALSTTGQLGFGDWKTYARSTIDASSVDRWKRLPAPVIRHLGEICNPTLERLGYEPVPITEEGAEDARRRYELGLLVNRMKGKQS